MSTSNIRTFYLISHLIVCFSHGIVGPLKAYNESTLAGLHLRTRALNGSMFIQLASNEDKSNVLFKKVALNASDDPNQKFHSNSMNHKISISNILTLNRSDSKGKSDAVTSEGFSGQFSEEQFNTSLNDGNGNYNSMSQNDLPGNEINSENLVFPIFKADPTDNRTIRSKDEFSPKNTNLLAFAHSIKIKERTIANDNQIYDDPTATFNHDRSLEDLTTEYLLLDFENSPIRQNGSADWNTTECAQNSNCSGGGEHAPTFNAQTLIKCVVLLGLGSTAVFGNVATLTSIIRRGRQNTSTVYLLLVHLSVADLMVTWFCIIGEGIWMLAVQWYAGNAFCKFFKFLQMLALYQSTFILVVIGFDRLCAVRFPMRRIKARLQVQKYVCIAWILSCGLSAPQAVIFRVVKGPFVEEFYQCVTYGFYTAPWQEQLYASVSLLCMFIGPLCVLVATYAATFATIANSGRNRVFGGGDRNPFVDARCKILRKAKVKSLWITVVIVSTFIVCWTPYYVSMIISVFLDADDQVGQGLHEVIFFFGSSTAVLNPLIYGAFHLRRSRPIPISNRTSSRGETTWAMSTLRRLRLVNGKSVNASFNMGVPSRRTTQKMHVEVF